jgi:CRP-like cAMP-binding protein
MALQKTLRRFPKDAVIIVEGSPAGGEISYLSRGTAIVEVKGSVLGTINPGEWFGELAAILGSTRTATVRAVTPCEVLVFKGVEDTNLYDAIARDGKMLRKLIEQLCLRLIETSRRHVGESSELADQAMRYRRAISGTLFVLERLSEKFKSKVMDETRQHLSALSGITTGQEADADPKFFPASRDSLFGKQP